MSALGFYRYSCLIILFLVFLTPTFRIPGVIGIRLEELFIGVWLIAFALLYRHGRLPAALIPNRMFWLFLFALLMMVSIALGGALQHPAHVLDLIKYIWLFKALMIYFIFYNYMHLQDGYQVVRQTYILKKFVWFGILLAGICYQQYFDLLGLNSLYIPYIAPTQAETLLPGYSSPRVVGMIGNPNAMGFIMVLCMLSHIYLYLQKQSSFTLPVFLILFVVMLMTLSRSAAIVFVFGSLVLFALYQRNWLFTVYKLILLSLATMAVVFAYLILKENEIIYNLIIFRFEILADGVREGSFAARFEAWWLNYQYFLTSPLFGVGPLPRADIFISADNEWLLFLRSYGLVGTLWLLLFLFYPIISRRAQTLEGKNLRGFSFAILTTTCVYMIPAGIITSTSLVPFLLVLMAVYDHPKWYLQLPSTYQQPQEAASQ